ncbi:MAG: apolipoprotein N-acyltransferase [Acidobacteria bacterium]|nr:MAG: apolipoprotein N-acyltransferase [Acidobacteriota bacterium]
MKVVWASVLRSAGLAASAGVVLALALPGLNWWPLVFVFPALFLESLRMPMRWWHAAVLGWFAGMVHWIVASHWVVDVLAGFGGFPVLGAWGGLVVMGLFLGSTWIPVAVVMAVVAPRTRPLIFPAVWILAEVARRYSPYLFPWNTTASCLADMPSLLGSLSVWGATGLGWGLVAVGTGAWALCLGTTRRIGVVVIGVAIVIIGTMTLIAPGPEYSGKAFTVALIQPGTSMEERWDPEMWPETTERVWALSQAASAQSPDLIVWPESAMPYRFDSDVRYRRQIREFSRSAGSVVVLNSVGRTADGGYTNSAFAQRPDGVVSRYDKVRLVPFGEYVPLWGRVFVSDSLVREIGAFTAGTEIVPLDAGIPLGLAVCYEIVFPNVVARQVRAGAQVLATLTNDAWYGTSWALDQHFAQAILRAVETRRWVIRAALTGISGAIDPSGHVVDRLEAGKQGLLLVELQPAVGRTPVVRWGDWWAWVCVVMVCVVLGKRRWG